MSEVAVLEAPPIPATAPSAPAAPAKLVRSRDEALMHLHNQVKKGADIKATRIRTGQDLDQARAAKLEWTTRCIEILNDLFDSPSVAEQCNDWVGRIYPEYAEFENFVEQFYAEMDHRIGRMKEVARKIEQMAAPETPRAARPAPQPQQAEPVKPISPPQQVISSLAGVLIVHNANDALRQTVAEFLESLDIDVSIVQELTDLANILERNRDIRFAVVLGDGGTEHDFELGFCAARVGLNRVILLTEQAAGAPEAGARGLARVALDASGGWQLQLAKQLRRGGVAVDLNRLC